jgi:hypothetical protein
MDDAHGLAERGRDARQGRQVLAEHHEEQPSEDQGADGAERARCRLATARRKKLGRVSSHAISAQSTKGRTVRMT